MRTTAARQFADRLLSEEDSQALTRHRQLLVRIGDHVAPVDSFEDASSKWIWLRDAHDLAGSTSPLVEIVDADTGEAVARVAYNGRVFDMERSADFPDGREIEVPHIKPLRKVDWNAQRVLSQTPRAEEVVDVDPS